MSIRDEYAELNVDSDYGHSLSYDWLRDTALLCFNPADKDGAEEEVICQAMVAAAEYIEHFPCLCTNTNPDLAEARSDVDHGVPYSDTDTCARCLVLGRYFDKRLDRSGGSDD